MTNEKILEVVKVYQKHLNVVHAERYPITITRKPDSIIGVWSHVRWMCDQIEIFVKEGRRDKAFRWLGFIQACLWMNGDYTLKQLANHNRSRKRSKARI